MSEKIIADKFNCFLWRYQQQVNTRTWQNPMHQIIACNQS